MKGRIKIASFICLLLMIALPLNVYAEGDSNIDSGGGGLGQGSGGNYWSSHDEGVRVTIVRASDGTAVSASVDLTNKQPSDIKIHFGKVSKTSYKNGAGLSVKVGGYSYINPTQALPQIISSSSGGANLTAIKNYFTDEQVLRRIAAQCGMAYNTLINGDYKLLIEPVAYVIFEGVRTAMTATEAAKYNQLKGGMLRSKMPSLSHKNLPLAMFLETSDLGYPAWTGSKTDRVTDEQIITSLGIGIVRFNEVITPEVIAADYEYRVDTDVITSVTISGGQSDPDNPVSVAFTIAGRSYDVSNVYYPEGASQLVWVKWHTPSTEQHMTINVSVHGGGSASKGTITANIVDLSKNPPPNPVADDRNDSYQSSNAIVPNNVQKTSSSWSVWNAKWHEYWVWHSKWVYHSGSHSSSCSPGCSKSHGSWKDEGEWKDYGWWDFPLNTYSASLSASVNLSTDEKAPTRTDTTIKSGYGVNISIETSTSSSQTVSTTGAQTAVSYFSEFYYKTYWRMLERTRSGYQAAFEFTENHYSTYKRRTHFTPIWYPDGPYKVYTYIMDCWTPDGMLSINMEDSIQISGSLWSDWHIAPMK